MTSLSVESTKVSPSKEGFQILAHGKEHCRCGCLAQGKQKQRARLVAAVQRALPLRPCGSLRARGAAARTGSARRGGRGTGKGIPPPSLRWRTGAAACTGTPFSSCCSRAFTRRRGRARPYPIGEGKPWPQPFQTRCAGRPNSAGPFPPEQRSRSSAGSFAVRALCDAFDLRKHFVGKGEKFLGVAAGFGDDALVEKGQNVLGQHAHALARRDDLFRFGKRRRGVLAQHAFAQARHLVKVRRSSTSHTSAYVSLPLP